jgi:uncharacterized protein YbjT (DUF2867 family)
MSKAFVAGATGYTGREVVRQLRLRGDDVVAHVRPDSTSLAEWTSRFRASGATVDSTPWQQDAISESIARIQPDTIFALLGTTRARASRAAEQGRIADYETVDYSMTHMLIEAARAAVTSATIVYLSAFGANADSRNEYLRVRGRIERELSASGLRFIAARPLFVSGTDRIERRPTERIGAVVSDGVLQVIGWLGGGRVRDRYRSITGPRLARALILAATDPHLSNATLEAADLQRLADPH